MSSVAALIVLLCYLWVCSGLRGRVAVSRMNCALWLRPTLRSSSATMYDHVVTRSTGRLLHNQEHHWSSCTRTSMTSCLFGSACVIDQQSTPTSATSPSDDRLQPLISEQPSNIYLNLEFDYLSTNSLYTIQHPRKFVGTAAAASSDPKRPYKGNKKMYDKEVADILLTNWYRAAAKWNLLPKRLRMPVAEHHVPDQKDDVILADQHMLAENPSVADVIVTSTTATAAAPPATSPYLKLNKALELRIAQLRDELGIEESVLKQEVDLLMQSDGSDESLQHFSNKLMQLSKASQQKPGKSGRFRSTSGVGFGSPASANGGTVQPPRKTRKGSRKPTLDTSTDIVQCILKDSSITTSNIVTTSVPVEDNAPHREEIGDLSPSAVTTEVEVPLETLREICRTHEARVICIGDVHGCADEVCDLLREVEFMPGDQVVFLGDLVVKGPKSVETVQLAMDIGALSVRGNHDHAVVREVSQLAQSRGQGSAGSDSCAAAGDTAASVAGAGSGGTDLVTSESGVKDQRAVSSAAAASVSSKMPQHQKVASMLTDAQAAWLAELPYFIRSLDLGAVFVHAGLQNDVRLPYQEPWIMMTMRSQLPTGRATSRSIAAYPWAKTWKGPLTAYFGHDTARGLQRYPSAYGIDTGCVYGGNLTAVLLPDQKIVSVPARQTYLKFK